MGGEHAPLSPSSAERWLTCPSSFNFNSDGDEESVYALEGTRAHELAALKAELVFGMIEKDDYQERYDAWRGQVRADGFTNEQADEMFRHAASWVTLLQGYVTEYDREGEDPEIYFETRVYPGIPECWGTADALIVTDFRIHVLDFKYGMGVRVDARDNPQLLLYGAGGVEFFIKENLYYDNPEFVRMTIHQPRIDNTFTTEWTTKDVVAWRDEVKARAEYVLTKPANDFGPSEAACKFCAISGQCRAQMDAALAEDFGDPALLSPSEMGQALSRIPEIEAWVAAAKAKAMKMAYEDEEYIPGWKVVLTAGRRTIVDPAAAIQTLIDEGFAAEEVADFKVKPLGTLEKLVGSKQALSDVLGGLLGKTEGNPTLAKESDRRPAITRDGGALDDFKEV